MLEPLAGRLKWERTDGGIRIVIPARQSWGAIRRLLDDLWVAILAYLGIVAIAGCVAYFRGLSAASFLKSDGVTSLFLASLGYCAGLVLVRMIPRLFGETIVTLTPAQIMIVWNIRIRHWTQTAPTVNLQSIDFIERSGKMPIQNKIGQNEIQLRGTNSILSFGEGVTREEASALIAKMMEFDPYLRHLPTEFTTGVEAN
jgi:hypothetical protein